MGKKRSSKLYKQIQHRVGKAIGKYDMIQDGDKIFVGISGGKDSLCLLHMLVDRRKWAPISYELHAVHIETSVNPRPKLSAYLKDLFEKLEVPYSFRHINIDFDKNKSKCFWCSWCRRKELFRMCQEMDFNRIAFGHHKDDIIETTLLNMFFEGNISTMNPVQPLFDDTVKIIRPMCDCDESAIETLIIEEMGLTILEKECYLADNTKRKWSKKLIQELQTVSPLIRENIFRSLSNIKHDYIDIRK